MHASRDQVLHHLRPPAVGDAIERDAGEALELVGEDLLSRAAADGDVGYFIRVRLGVGEELFEIRGWDRVRERERVVILGDQRYGGEIGQGILRILVEHRVDRFEVRAQQQIVAIAWLCQHVARRQHAASTRFVLNNNTLTKHRREPIGDEPSRNISRAAGPEPDDETDRPRRIGIARERRHGNEQGCDTTNKAC